MKKNIPNPFGIEDVYFKLCFSAPSYRIFAALLVGWVLTLGKHTISKVILTMRLHESRHFASIYRFLGKGRWDGDRVSRFLYKAKIKPKGPAYKKKSEIGLDLINMTHSRLREGDRLRVVAAPGSNVPRPRSEMVRNQRLLLRKIDQSHGIQ